jgi:hypothetical protein
MQGEDGHQAFHLAPVTLSDICRSKWEVSVFCKSSFQVPKNEPKQWFTTHTSQPTWQRGPLLQR